jgi:predicted aspartyl protease
MPMVKVSIGPGRDATFGIDTGSSYMAIRSGQADLWGLSRKDKRITVFDGRKSVELSQTAFIDRLELHNVELTEIEAVIVELPSPIDGILGISFLRQCALLIDGTRLRAVVIRSDQLSIALREIDPNRTWSRLSLKLGDQGPYVELPTGNGALKMLVDTGAAWTALSAHAGTRLNLSVVRTSDHFDERISGEVLEEERVLRLDRLSVGEWTCDVEAPETPDSASVYDGTLGYDILGRIPFVVDVPEDSLWIANPPAGEPGQIRITEDDRLAEAFRDPMAEIRERVAASAARLPYAHMLPLLAGLLNDDVGAVRHEAARTISSYAKETWPDESIVDDARKWWAAHKDDEEFR